VLVLQYAINSVQHDHDEQPQLFDEQFTDDDFQTTGLFHNYFVNTTVCILLAAQLDIDYLERLNPTSSDEVQLYSYNSRGNTSIKVVVWA